MLPSFSSLLWTRVAILQQTATTLLSQVRVPAGSGVWFARVDKKARFAVRCKGVNGTSKKVMMVAQVRRMGPLIADQLFDPPSHDFFGAAQRVPDLLRPLTFNEREAYCWP